MPPVGWIDSANISDRLAADKERRYIAGGMPAEKSRPLKTVTEVDRSLIGSAMSCLDHLQRTAIAFLTVQFTVSLSDSNHDLT